MGKIMTVNRKLFNPDACGHFGPRAIAAPRGNTLFPPEFRKLPRFYPPDVTDGDNPDFLWLVYDAWKSPPIEGKVVCYRGAVTLENGEMIGFFTDGISVPALAWSIFKMHPFSMPELCFALGHDFSYSAELAERLECDRWLSEWAKMINISNMRRKIVYRVVKNFGWYVWNKHTDQSIAETREMCQVVDEGTEPIWSKTVGNVAVVV